MSMEMIFSSRGIILLTISGIEKQKRHRLLSAFFNGEIADTKISAEVVSSADLLYNGMGDEVEKEKNLPRRKDLRLKQYDYSSKGAYFVTICIKDRKRILSDIIKPPTPTNKMLPPHYPVQTFLQ